LNWIFIYNVGQSYSKG